MPDAGHGGFDLVVPDPMQDGRAATTVEEPSVQEVNNEDVMPSTQPATLHDADGKQILQHGIISVDIETAPSPVRHELVVDQGNLSSLYTWLQFKCTYMYMT